MNNIMKDTLVDRLYSHILRLKSVIVILLLCAWYVSSYGPSVGEEPSRLWIIATVTWKYCLAIIFFHVSRHEMFPYLSVGTTVSDCRKAMRLKDAKLTQALAIQLLSYCILLGCMYMATIGAIVKW